MMILLHFYVFSKYLEMDMEKLASRFLDGQKGRQVRRNEKLDMQKAGLSMKK
jgi:hypothetical protein